MKSILSDVRAFHEVCDVPIRSRPSFPGIDRVTLRNRLLWEEFNEYQEAVANRDIVATADAIADIIYIAVGTALEFGIPLDRVWDEVQRSNMAKVDPVTGKVRKRFDGKVEKPRGWRGPDIEGVMEGVE